jgi:hypothetical protein
MATLRASRAAVHWRYGDGDGHVRWRADLLGEASVAGPPSILVVSGNQWILALSTFVLYFGSVS